MTCRRPLRREKQVWPKIEEVSIIRRSGKVYHAYGQSVGGRYLLVVFLYLGRGQAQVVTARDMTQKEH